MSFRIITLAVLIIVATLFIDQPTVAAKGDRAESAMTPCMVGKTAAPVGFWTWPANTNVNVYLREPDFSASDVSAVRIAVENWDATTKDNGSNVRFIFHGLTRETKSARGEMTVIRKRVSDKNKQQRAVLQAHSSQGDRFIDYALLLVDPLVTNPVMLMNVLAHELGHSLGLMDCYKCKGQSTAMVALKDGDESNGIDGPTTCDKREVMAAYVAMKPRATSASLALALNNPKDNLVAAAALVSPR